MFTLRLLTVLFVFSVMLPICATEVPTKSLDSLADLPSSSWLSDCYSNHPYFVYATAGMALFTLLYAFNEGFREKVKSALGIEKGCGCGCRSECGCRTGARSECSMKPNKNNEICACCAPRPATLRPAQTK